MNPHADDGGVDGFRARLAAFLTAARTPLALTNIQDRSELLARRQHALLGLANRYARGGAAGRAAIDAAVAEARAAAATAQTAALARVRERLDERMTELWDDPSWHERAAALMDAPAEAVADWLAARTGWFTEEAVRAATPELGRLAAATTAPVEAALRGARRRESRFSLAADGPVALEAAWDPAALPPIATPRVEPPQGGAEPRRWHRGERRIAPQREQAIRQFLERYREGLSTQLEHWLQTLEHETRRRTEEEAQRLDRYLAAPATPAQTEALTRVNTHLADIAAELVAARAALGDRAPRAAEPVPRRTAVTVAEATAEVEAEVKADARADAAGHDALRCVVCARQRSALVADLARRQFELATREAEQAALADAHGLCPAHTWSYASVASPLGISAAYAAPAEAAAGILEGALDPAAVRRRAAELASGPHPCPVCDAVERAEQAALAALGDGDTVCLRHLARAAESETDTAVLLALARRLADAFTRHAQDMRGYALKREALARHLLTAEETRAHRETLMLLAGDPALALPLADEAERDELRFEA